MDVLNSIQRKRLHMKLGLKNFGVLGALFAVAAQAHVVLDEPVALAGTYYKASLRVGHGCSGSSTTAVKVFIPDGLQGAKPMPKPGWVLSTRSAPLVKPYTSHGKRIESDVVEITWTAASRENALPDAYFDEYVLRGQLTAQAGPVWFRVLQTCEQGFLDWAQIPEAGTSTRGLKSPAALLEVLPSESVQHQH